MRIVWNDPEPMMIGVRERKGWNHVLKANITSLLICPKKEDNKKGIRENAHPEDMHHYTIAHHYKREAIQWNGQVGLCMEKYSSLIKLHPHVNSHHMVMVASIV